MSDTPENTTADFVRVTNAMVQHQLTHRPYAALGVAVAVGFVAAGGLASPAAWGLARLGARIAVAAATRKLGQTLLENDTGA